MPSSRWSDDPHVARGDDYDARFRALEASGHDVHGEADFVQRFAPASVLDAGCGTGRVGIELARRGVDVVGIDLDETMLDAARRNGPSVQWLLADLLDVEVGRTFDVVVAAGNVMIFLEPGSEAGVVANLAGHVAPAGRLVSGFQLQPGRYGLDEYDAACEAAGLVLEDRCSTWDGDPFTGGDYAVSVHRRLS